MRARRAENPEQNRTAVSCGCAEGARRTWAQLYRALVRAQPGPERSAGTRPDPAVESADARPATCWTPTGDPEQPPPAKRRTMIKVRVQSLGLEQNNKSPVVNLQ